MHFFLYRFRRIKVYALIGKSGSGKSFRARMLLDRYNIEMLIDDGLVIRDDKILAGKTAKSEKNVLDAVGTAIFKEAHHRNEARRALEKEKFKRVLVLGTSDKMTNKICHALLLPAPSKVIRIEEIASAEEIETARMQRDGHGKHVIPVPAFEMEQSFPHLLVSSLRVLYQKGRGLLRKDYVYQKSIVRPSYSNKGTIRVSEKALHQLISQLVRGYEELVEAKKIKFYSEETEYIIEVYISVPVAGLSLNKILPRLHDYLIAKIQAFSGIIVRKLDIIIDTIYENNA